MKESEFIELLNLYVDHEISDTDAARLEAEVMSDGGRRRIYRQYCSMDKACSLLAAKYSESAVPAAAIEERLPPRWGWATGVSMAGLMAAACVAVLLVTRTHSPAPAAAAHPAAAVAANNSATPLAVYDRPLQLVLSLNNGNPAVDTLLRSSSASNQNDPLAWIAQMQMGSLSPLPALPINFQAPQEMMGSGTSAAPAPAAQSETGEMAAFRFQR